MEVSSGTVWVQMGLGVGQRKTENMVVRKIQVKGGNGGQPQSAVLLKHMVKAGGR